MNIAARITLLCAIIFAPVFSYADSPNGKCTAGINCSAAKDFCALSLDLDPISCGIYYGCCNSSGSAFVSDPDICDDDCSDDDVGSSEEGLTYQGTPTIQAIYPPSGTALGKAVAEVAVDSQKRVFYNWWMLGGGARGWKELDGGGQASSAAAATLMGQTLFVAIRGNDGYLQLNQGAIAGKFTGWQHIPFLSKYAPAASSSHNTGVLVAADNSGRIFYSFWQAGGGGSRWTEIDGHGQTDAAPAAALVGNYLFVIIKGLDGNVYLNQGALGKTFVGWQRMGIRTNVAPAAASIGQAAVVAITDPQSRISYNWWTVGQAGRGWVEMSAGGSSTHSPGLAIAKGNYAFAFIQGIDGKLYLNQGTLGGNFVGWRAE